MLIVVSPWKIRENDEKKKERKPYKQKKETYCFVNFGSFKLSVQIGKVIFWVSLNHVQKIIFVINSVFESDYYSEKGEIRRSKISFGKFTPRMRNNGYLNVFKNFDSVWIKLYYVKWRYNKATQRFVEHAENSHIETSYRKHIRSGETFTHCKKKKIMRRVEKYAIQVNIKTI